MYRGMNHRTAPVWAAVAGSVLISVFFRLCGVDINNDGVLYLRVADRFREEGVFAATALYGWPFFSMLVAWLSQLGLSLLNAAWLLGVASFALLSGSFVAVVARFYPASPLIHYTAVPVILLLPELAELRSEVLRDNAAFALLLFSLLPLLRFVERREPWALLLWGASVALGALFRIEQALLLLSGVFVLLFIKGGRRWAVALLLLTVLAGALTLWLLQHYAPESRVRDLYRWLHFYAGDLGTKLSSGAARLEAAVLNDYSQNYARDAMATVLLVLLIGKLLKGLTPVYAAFLWFTRRDRPALQSEHRAIWQAYFAGVLLPPLLFVFQHFFLTQRYVFGAILMLLLLVPAAACTLFQRIRAPRLRVGLAVLLLLILAAATVRKAPEEDVQLLVGQWLAERPGSLWTNSVKAGFFADAEFDGRVLTVDWQAGWLERRPAPGKFDWLVLVVDEAESKQAAALLSAEGMERVTRFEGRRKDAEVWAVAKPE